jgi:adenylosuccinate synthase
MMQVKAVIGAGYGDEGKGMWTDYLVRTSEKPIVVRNNGGAQVGHTVVVGDKRRIFSHLGSGTLRGAPTLFTRNTVVNPMLYLKETKGRNAGLNPKVYIESQAQVTTPFDMLLNQCLEMSRGDGRHGSTGTGFGVTLERVERGLTLSYRDITTGTNYKRLTEIRTWCQNRLPKPINSFMEQAHDFFIHKEMLEMFIDDCNEFCEKTETWKDTFKNYETVIFENGQGLMLDQEFGEFPNVTRSNTGFRNIGKMMKSLGWFNQVPTHVYYLSRCYTTRHGAGPLPDENHSLPGISMSDETNVPNEFQGTLRLAPLNLYDIQRAIRWDQVSHPKNTTKYKVLTCCDHIVKGENAKYIDRDGRFIITDYDQFIDKMDQEFNIRSYSAAGDSLTEWSFARF